MACCVIHSVSWPRDQLSHWIWAISPSALPLLHHCVTTMEHRQSHEQQLNTSHCEAHSSNTHHQARLADTCLLVSQISNTLLTISSALPIWLLLLLPYVDAALH